MAVNTQKLLPSSKRETTGVGIANNKKSSMVLSQTSVKNISIIKVKVIQIENILKGTLASEKKSLDQKKRKESAGRRERQEEKLETKPNLRMGQIKMPSAPRLGIFDWIKNFIGNIILGYFAVRLIKHLPKIIPIIKFIGQATDFAINIGGKLLNGLATFIDWGYKAYDATRGFIKQLGGENFAKGFDKFIGAIDTALFLTSVLAADLAIEAMTGGGESDRIDPTQRPKPGQGGRPRITTSGGRTVGGPDIRNPFRQRPTVTLGKGGTKVVLGTVKPLVKRLPIIGALLDFGLSVALGEDPGRAAFKAIGAGLLGSVGVAIGSVVPVAGNLIGGIVGGIIGDTIGGALYDMFFGGKKPQPKGKVQGQAGGGITRGGKVQTGAKREIGGTKKKGKYKRTLAQKKPSPIEIETKDKALKETGEQLDKTKYFGPILAITSKIMARQEPTQKDYENVGLGINLLISKGIEEGQLKGGLVAAFAEGGMVDEEFLSAAEKGSDIGNWVARTFMGEIESNAQKTLRLIRQRREEEEIKEKQKQQIPSLVVGPGGIVTGGNADFWALVAIASLESGTPQGRADVAQSIYNRLASGIYSGNTIKELIVSGNGRQYQPVGRAVNEFRAISDKESAINAVMAANRLSRSQAERFINDTASAIQNKELQQSAAQFVGGRTDFWAEGLTPPSDGIGYVIRHGHRFGWFVGPAAIAYGRKNPGPARAPALGDIVVMGGGLMGGPLGTGAVSSVDQFTSIASQYGLSLTSSYRSGDRGYHGKNRARDYSNDAIGKGTPQQLSFAKHLAEKYGSSLTQLIYTPLGYGIANGKKVGLDYWGSSTNAQHYHHVHVALAKGGRVRKPSIASIGERGPEFVFDADTTSSLDMFAPGLLERLNIAKTKPEVANILQSYTSYEQPYGQPEIIEVPIPVPMPISGGDGYSFSSAGVMGDGEESDSFDSLYVGG